jgi:pimeloyl-ACP methyl ester carboxylesterase
MNRRQSLGLTFGGFAAGVLAACGSVSNNVVAQESANKATIVMIHGAWHWGGCFQKVATAVAASGHPVILPDLKSHGYSPATYDQVTSMADYVAPVAAILENATSPVVLLGHSMGGASLTWLAERYPGKIRKLI